MQKQADNEVLIEPATGDDLDDILRIEQASFSAPWTRKMFEAELDGNPFGRLCAVRAGGGDGTPGAVAGYICYWVVFEELRLMNLAVDPSARRRGIASALLRYALADARECGARRGVLEVRASNVAARALYERAGFRQIAVRAAYYTNPVEDAVIMAVDPLNLTLNLSDRRWSMPNESVIMDQLRETSSEFRELEESHQRLDQELDQLHKRHVLTPQEELLKKQIQKEKLAKKDKMAELIRQYRERQASSAAR